MEEQFSAHYPEHRLHRPGCSTQLPSGSYSADTLLAAILAYDVEQALDHGVAPYSANPDEQTYDVSTSSWAPCFEALLHDHGIKFGLTGRPEQR